MKALTALVVGLAVAVGACSQAPSTGGQGAAATAPAASGDIRFKLTFTFDSHPVEPDFWNTATFTTTGTLSRSFLEKLTTAPTFPGATWPSSGSQTYGDYACTTPDQCLDACTGEYANASWQDEPQIALIERTSKHVSLHVLLSADPLPTADQFWTTPGCVATNGGFDGFPPMVISIDGLDTGAPTFSAEPAPYSGTAQEPPGTVYKLVITPA